VIELRWFERRTVTLPREEVTQGWLISDGLLGWGWWCLSHLDRLESFGDSEAFSYVLGFVEGSCFGTIAALLIELLMGEDPVALKVSGAIENSFLWDTVNYLIMNR